MDTSMFNDLFTAFDKAVELEHMIINEMYTLSNEPWHNCLNSIERHNRPYLCHIPSFHSQVMVPTMMEIMFIRIGNFTNNSHCP
mmetsp:Transcript_25859/g.42012  ORF Transcript_25859/g.42012 Transcript_25859/m.42012 type:complete len:84 (-) Transcript_25859:191-442(-)